MKTIAEFQQEQEHPVIMADHRGIIIYINSRFEAVFGWSAAELVGQLLGVVLPDNFRDAHYLSFSRFQLTEVSTVLNHPLRLKARTRSGQDIEAEHFIIGEKRDGHWVFAATLKPITG